MRTHAHVSEPIDFGDIMKAAEEAVEYAARFDPSMPGRQRRAIARQRLAQRIDDLATWPPTILGRVAEALDGPAASGALVLLDSILEYAHKKHLAKAAKAEDDAEARAKVEADRKAAGGAMKAGQEAAKKAKGS